MGRLEDARIRVERAVFDALPPRLRLPARRARLRLAGKHEPHLDLLARAITPGRRAIDVGANRGDWAWVLHRRCTHVECFEPQPWCADTLEAARLPGVNVHREGLSDADGELALHVPLRGGTMLTTCASVVEPPGPHRTLRIPVRRLDDHHFTDVELVKIDVEGHETAVLAGAIETLTRELPVVTVEVDRWLREDGDPSAVIAQMAEIGYGAYFMLNGTLRPATEFDLAAHQEGPDRGLVRDFIFVPEGDGRLVRLHAMAR